MGAIHDELSAFHSFLSAMPPDSGLAFVLVLHAGARHEPPLLTRLTGVTDMPVVSALDGVDVAANHVYVAPLESVITVASGRLQIRQGAGARELDAVIDTFFCSLAEDQGARAVCIALAGSDPGAAALRAIKAHGALALAQQAESAHTGHALALLVDDILPVAEMPSRLMRHASVLHSAGAWSSRALAEMRLPPLLRRLRDVGQGLARRVPALRRLRERVRRRGSAASRVRPAGAAAGAGAGVPPGAPASGDPADPVVINLLESTQVPTIFVDRDLHILRFNTWARGLFRLIDMDTGRHIGDITRRFLIEGDFEDHCQAVIDTGEARNIGIIRPADDARFVMRVAPLHDRLGRISGAAITFADTTHLGLRLDKLRRSEVRHRALLGGVAAAVWSFGPGGRIVEPQPGLAAYTGQRFDSDARGVPAGWQGERVSAYRGHGWLAAVHPRDRDEIQRSWSSAVATRHEARLAARLFHAPSGAYRHVEIVAAPLAGSSGGVEEWAGMLVDVHERESRVRSLADHLSRLELAIGATHLGVFDRDAVSGATRSNEQYRRILGLPVHVEPSYEVFLSCVHPEDRERVHQVAQAALDPAGDGVCMVDFRVCWPDGTVRWVDCRARAHFDTRDGTQTPRRMVGIIEDVTTTRQVRAELERRAAQQAAVSELGVKALQQPALQDVFLCACDIVTRTLQLPFCMILERLPAGELLLSAGIGWKPGLIGTAHIPADRAGQAGHALRLRQCVIVRNLVEETRFEPARLLLDHTVRSGMSVIINDPDGEPWGVLGVHSDRARDFTQEDIDFVQAVASILACTLARSRSELALREAKQGAESANAAKDRFLAELSHELRIPLTPVLAAVEALASDFDIPEQAHERLRMVRRNLDLEKQLLDDLLDLTRINQGKLVLHRQPVGARELIERALGTCEQDATARGLVLQNDMGGKDWMLHVDPWRAEQILLNLLNNAIKYTPRGGRIEVRCVEAPASMLRIEIADTGMGMDQTLLSRVFNPFEQGPPPIAGASSSGGHQRPGLGLGLAIVRALVQGHGGTVSAQSAGPDRGTTFHIELPLATPDLEDAVELDKSQPVTLVRGGRIRVLLVEDHEDSAEILATVLQDRGVDITVARSGSEAVSMASQHSFDIVVSDIGLPDMPGYELLPLLRERQPTLAGIAYSGYGRDADVQRCLAAGFCKHLTKPVDLGKLERAIHRLVLSG